MRLEGFHGESRKMHNRFAVAPCNFSFVSLCGSEKNRRELDVSNSILCSSSGEDITVSKYSDSAMFQEISLHGDGKLVILFSV